MTGVLRLYKQTVKEVMIPVSSVHMLPDTTPINQESLQAILDTG